MTREFRNWFQEITKHEPYTYQTRFATDNSLPQLVDIPTGLGKTATTILGWLWRRRFHEDVSIRNVTPRRLVYCLPMRVLVEQTYENAEGWLRALSLWGSPGDGKISVHLLMGGEIDMDWDAHPEADTILIGTQDQLLSRALNRGYAMSRYRWPMHFSLLNNDCLWIFDEVQLMGMGLPTTAQLQAFREKFGTYGPVHSLWMSATLKKEALATVDFSEQAARLKTLSLNDQDKQHQEVSKRTNAKKPLAKAQTMWRAETADDYAATLAKEVIQKHKTKSFSLVIVNRVNRAQEVFKRLQALVRSTSQPPDLLLIHSRFRSAERKKIQARLKEAPVQGRIIVATQAIEAGIDLSAQTLFTELAPWSSLVQRFGRCNRYGEYNNDHSARIFWIDLETQVVNKKGENEPNKEAAQPYETGPLEWARKQLTQLADVGPQTVSGFSDPSPALPAYVLRKKDLIELFDTTPDLAGNDIDVSRYIRETENNDVQIYWRTSVDINSEPRDEELCSVSIKSFRIFLKKKKPASRWNSLDQEWIPVTDRSVWPGLTIRMDIGAGGYSEELGWTGDENDLVTALPPPPGATPLEAYDDNRRTFIGRYVTLTEHAKDVAEALNAFRKILFSFLPDVPWDDLSKAARWHDIGKAHEVFQTMLPTPLPSDDLGGAQPPWAKSAHKGGVYQRPHFRHELASALALLQHKESDLAAYLAAAHHGKVRLSIRSLPGEIPSGDGRPFARGVWEGDALPAVDLGDKIQSQQLILTLAYMGIGEGPHGASWLERTLKLRDEYGPFRLAWMETLVRVADWRGTRKEEETK